MMNEHDPELEREIEARFRRKNRAIICRRCGAFGTTIMDGKEFAYGMPGLKYKVCGSCGHAEAKTAPRRREKL